MGIINSMKRYDNGYDNRCDNRYGNRNDNRCDNRNRIVGVYLPKKKSKFYKLVFIVFFITAIRNLDFRYLVQFC